MNNKITSLSNVAMAAFIHLLLELWRAFLDFSLVLPEFAADSTANLALYGLGYVLVFAAWLLGLKSARAGKRGGMVLALAIGALFWVGVDWGTIFFYCPGGCEDRVFDITTYLNILVGGLALVGWIANLTRSRSSA